MRSGRFISGLVISSLNEAQCAQTDLGWARHPAQRGYDLRESEWREPAELLKLSHDCGFPQ